MAAGRKTKKRAKRAPKKRGQQTKDETKSIVSARGTRRGKINKAINQQALREKIAAGNHHYHIEKGVDKYIEIIVELSKKKTISREEQAAYVTRLGAIKSMLDARFKLLNKYLPDLRAISFEDGEGNNSIVEAAKAWAAALDREAQ